MFKKKSHKKMGSTRKALAFVTILLAVIFHSEAQNTTQPSPSTKTVTQIMYVTVTTTSLVPTTVCPTTPTLTSTETMYTTVTTASLIPTTVCPTPTIPPTNITPTPSSVIVSASTAPPVFPIDPSARLDCGLVCHSVKVTAEEPPKPAKKKKDCNKDKKTGDKGLNTIKKFENLEKKAYKCPAGVWTIGYGHTKGVKEGDEIDEAQADKFLKEDVKCAENTIKKHVKVCLTQNQFDALVSFIFNVGKTAFKNSTLLKKINLGKHDEVPAQLKRWVKANGKKLNGLVNRRNEEIKLYKSKK